LDGAHNSHAVRRLVETLDEYYPGQRFHCLFGALKDKDVGDMLALMAPHVSHWHVTKTPYPRFRELADVRDEIIRAGGVVDSAEELSSEYVHRLETPLLITGSLYMIGACIEILKGDYAELAFFRDLEPSTNEHR
jgi:dihydrofolate synthase/folylpolyglutamate synthase